MHYQHNTAWLEEIDRVLKTYRQDVLKDRAESPDPNDVSYARYPANMLLPKIEEKIRDAKHVIRRCRNERVWIPALLQEPARLEEDLPVNLHSLDMQHRYEKALQKYKRRLDRYERLKNELQEKAHVEEEQ